MKRTIVLILLGFSFFTGAAQTRPDSSRFFDEFNFITHLAKHKLFQEAEKEKDRLFAKTNMDPLYKDSVNFFLGLEYYHENKLDQAHNYFMSISDQVFFYYRARYLAGTIDAEKDRADSAISHYLAIEESTSGDLNELKQFEIAGLHLLNKQYTLFDSLAHQCRFQNPLLQEEMSNLSQYALVGKKIRRKSPFVAGALSAVIPGLGKVYAGNNGQALASFLTCGLMGAVAAENYLHFGIQHPQTIFFTGLFGLFYVGNIWGSAVSVQLIKFEKQLENKHNILVSLKLPVSRFFN